MRLGRLDRGADVAGRLVDRGHGLRHQCASGVETPDTTRLGFAPRPARPPDAGACASVTPLASAASLTSAPPPADRASSALAIAPFAAGLAGDPLVGVESGERTARADVDEARRVGELGARVGEVELLRDTLAPQLSRKSAPNETISRAAAKSSAGHGAPYACAFARAHREVGFAVVRQMARREPERREPLIEESAEAARLVARSMKRRRRASGHAAQRRSAEQRRERGVPGGRRQLAALPHHRPAEAIGIVQPLQRGLAARAERAAVHRVLGIPLELDRAAVARFGDDAASGGAFAAGVL